MTLTLSLPDELVEELDRASSQSHVSRDEYAAEALYQALAASQLGEDGKLENRPDWQASLDRARADREAGRLIPQKEIVEWRKARLGQPGAPLADAPGDSGLEPGGRSNQ